VLLKNLTADAVTARLAGVKAAQEALGHTTSATTERHYLTQVP
jgi:integrase